MNTKQIKRTLRRVQRELIQRNIDRYPDDPARAARRNFAYTKYGAAYLLAQIGSTVAVIKLARSRHWSFRRWLVTDQILGETIFFTAYGPAGYKDRFGEVAEAVQNARRARRERKKAERESEELKENYSEAMTKLRQAVTGPGSPFHCSVPECSRLGGMLYQGLMFCKEHAAEWDLDGVEVEISRFELDHLPDFLKDLQSEIDQERGN